MNTRLVLHGIEFDLGNDRELIAEFLSSGAVTSEELINALRQRKHAIDQMRDTRASNAVQDFITARTSWG